MRRRRSGDDDEEEDSEEEEEADLEVASPAAVDSFRCIMCEKAFRHADNLRVHLQSHLGTRAKLNSCGLCRDGRNHNVYSVFQPVGRYVLLSLFPQVPRICLGSSQPK